MNGLGRPTALTRRIDLSASGQRASGAPASFHLAVGVCFDCQSFPCACKGPRTERCVCGGTIAAANDPAAIAAAVRAHQDTPGHSAWREGRR